MEKLLLALILLLPLPAIASTDPINYPICYMITAKGKLIDLTYMCNASVSRTETSKPSITASDVCRAFAADVLNAQNQFQRNRANEGLRYCLQNKGSIQNEIDSE
jgi:hypothetical protein